MTFDAREVSTYGGAPVGLYEFVRGPVTWRYCTADRDLIVGGNPYKAVAISDSGIPQSGDPSSDDVTVEMPAGEAVPALFRGTPPTDPITLTIRRMHYGDTDSRVFWVGTIAAVQRAPDELGCKIVCKNLAASFEADGVRLTWTRGCPYVLYDLATCKVAKASFRITSTVSATSGRYVTAPSCALHAADEFSGGWIEWTTPDGVIERRGVSRHEGASLFLYGLADGVPVSGSVFVYFGCNRTPDRCRSKFNNLPNYGGFPALPGVSPFDGRNNF